MLLAWVRKDYQRTGPLSYDDHQALYPRYVGRQLHIRAGSRAIATIVESTTET